jgi:hypothetical protein
MKRILLSIIMIAFTGFVFGQNQIFISEYVEGSGNNRALELYNPTNTPVVLQDSGFQLVRYSNGGSSKLPIYTVDLTGIVPAKGTWGAVSDKRAPNGTGYDTMVDPALQAKADTFLCPVYSVNKMFYFNGDDAVTLEKSDGTFIDIFGEIGVDPGDAWTMDSAAGYTSAYGGRWWTKNHTLIRKAVVVHGVTTNPSPFIVANEWDSLPNNTFQYLGSHPHTLFIEAPVKSHNAFFYPNPATSGWFLVKANYIIESVEILNVVGQKVADIKNPSRRGDLKVNTSQFVDGLYVVKINFADNTSISKKIVIKN